MFIDEAVVELVAGSGGNGCLAFRREKYVAMGGPFGGNGGKGSDIIFKVDPGLNTLIDFKYKKIIKGHKGENGLGKGMHGKNAEDIIIPVPLGTVVTDYDTNLVIADLTKNGEEYVIAKGGRGGRGNMAFKTQSNPAPNYAENGEPGEKKTLHVELKLLADVGLVGLPSVGKSTILSMVSRSKPKIAAYHFTTLSPNLGVVKARDGRSFVMADLPGLIEGASEGAGLGDRFLRHIERTKVIAHVIDMGGVEGRDAYDDYVMICEELGKFSQKLLQKPSIIIANKMDVEGAEERLKEFKKKVTGIPIYEISAMKHEGLEDVLDALADLIDQSKETDEIYEDDQYESHVLYKFQKEAPYTITKERQTKDGAVWVIKGAALEKLLRMTNFSTDEAAYRFARKLTKLGVDDKLREMGAKSGDIVQILDFSFDFKE